MVWKGESTRETKKEKGRGVTEGEEEVVEWEGDKAGSWKGEEEQEAMEWESYKRDEDRDGGRREGEMKDQEY